MFRSIRWRIAIPFVLLTATIIAGLGGYILTYVRQTHLQALEERLSSEARLVSDNMAQLVEEGASRDRMDELAKHWAQILNARVTLIAADGTVLGDSHEDRLQMDNHDDRIEFQRAMRDGLGSSIRYSLTVKTDMMYTAAISQVGNETVGVARVAWPLREIESYLAHLQRTLLGTMLLALILAVGISLIISQYTTRPLRELTHAAQRLAAGELHRVSAASTHDEVSVLARAFNTMASQLHDQIQALKTESGKLSAVLQQMTDGVVIVGENGAVKLFNPAAERMFGVKETNALDRSLAGVLRHHKVVELWQRCQESGELQETNFELGLKRMSIHAGSIELGQALPGSILLLFQDVTRIRQLETVRRDFISNISHELRTPLASLKALTETLQDTALDDPPAARRFLRQMETEVDSLSLMVSELLELVRIESGRVPLQLKSTAPHTILSTAAERLRLQAERGGLSLEIEGAEDLPCVLADPPRIEQVVVNLLHNAIKYTPPGGKITLSARLWEDRDNAPSILFSVKDTGTGISQEDLPRIFERFYKADRARSGGGTGLGLAIARHLVEAHMGKIWAESVEGKGSTFSFYLPVMVN